MRHFVTVVGVVLLFALLLASTVFLRAPGGGAPVDPATPIHLADGRVVPLSEVIEAGERETSESDGGSSLATAERAASEADAAGEASTRGAVEAVRRRRGASRSGDPIFDLAQAALADGRNDEALALFLSVPRDSTQYARARRRAGWDVLTKRQGKTREGARYVHEALRLRPFEGNSWQDASRVYAASFGWEID
jgi:hypothetical protein